MRAHEIPDEEPYPEKVNKRPQPDPCLKQEAEKDFSAQVHLRHNLVRNLYCARDEGHSRVKVWIDILVLLEWIAAELDAGRCTDRGLLLWQGGEGWPCLLPETHEKHHYDEVDRGM